MNVTTINLANLRNGEYISYIRGYLRILDRNDPDAMGIEDQFNAMEANVDAVEVIFQQDQASDLTEVIAGLDADRDKYLIGIASIVNGYLNHYDESKVQMAKQLNHQIAVYGTPSSIALQPLQQQLATIDNLIDDLRSKPALSAAITAFQLTDWLGQLEVVNDNLRDAYDDRVQQRAGLPAGKIRDLRVAGYDLYYQLRDMLMAQALIADYAAPYATVIREINDLTNSFNDVLARRN